ncbi:MAG: AI-2E family transporter [Alphaproteobacteria bacterium]|nr:MAG: AI-2E family transporter [Alphaproteobacteria bacterium]
MSETKGGQGEAVGPSPTRIKDAQLRFEAARAAIWAGVIGLVLLAIFLAQSLLVIFGAMVFAAMVDGGARLLSRALKVGRIWCVAIVLVATTAFLMWAAYFAGATLSREAAEFPRIIEEQLALLFEWLRAQGFEIRVNDLQGLAGSLTSGVGTVTKAIGGILGGIATLIMIVIIGIYLAIDPNLYERGVAWVIPEVRREAFYDTINYQAFTLRRLLAGRLAGMVIEGIFTWALLAFYGVPMAALLGLLTGLLAFIPNIGALVSGALMVLVGFSGGTEMGLYTVFVYVLVQHFDGYVLVPLIAKKTVDLAPALVLSAQLIFGVLFGILGLALADPLLAMIKVGLERRSARIEAQDATSAALETGAMHVDN